MSVQPPANLPPDWEDRRDEVLAPLLAIWETARQDNDEDLTPEKLCPNGPAELWAALAEDIECLKRFASKFMETGQCHAQPERASQFATEVYQGIEPIGEGGQGEVIRAKDVRLNRDVAVKQLKQHWIWNPSARLRLEQEAQITGRLEHPGVIPVYGFGHDREGRPFYAMRYLSDERTLEDAITEAYKTQDALIRSAKLRKLLNVFATVCRTIDYAHSQNIIHRDIKPSNIMIGDYGEVLVADWGLAKSLEDSHRENAGDICLETDPTFSKALLTIGVAGTLSYMSPEQALETSLATKASDIYSLGATLYHLLTGRPAFEGESISELLNKVRVGTFVHPRKVRSDAPAALAAVCVKAMEFAPADRYANATLLADEIDHWLADEPVSAWPDPIFDRLRRWIKRHRAMATSIAAGLLVAVVTLSGAAIFLDAARRREQDANDALAAANLILAVQNVELRRPQYASQFQVARSLWQTLEFDEASRVLASMDQDLRGIEWHFLKAACLHPQQISLRGPQDLVNSIGIPSIIANAISADGSRLVIAARKQSLLKPRFTWSVRLLDLESSKILWERESDRLVKSLSFDQNGSLILVEYEPLVAPVIGLDAAFNIQWPDLRSDGSVTQAEAPNSLATEEPTENSVEKQKLDPPVQEVWETMSGKTLSNDPSELVVTEPNPVYLVERVANENGVRLPTGGGLLPAVQTIRFNLTEEDLRPDAGYRIDSTLVIPTESAITTAVIDSTKKIAATAHEDGAIRLWTVPGSHSLGQLPAMSTKVRQLVFGKDTKSLRWLAEQSAEQGFMACFSADIAHLIVLPQPVDSWPDMQFLHPVANSEDRRTIAILEMEDMPKITAWDIASGKLKGKFAVENVSGSPSAVQVDLNHDGTLVAVSTHEQGDLPSLRVYDVSSGQQLWTHKNFASPITFKSRSSELFACRLGTAQIALLDGNNGNVADESLSDWNISDRDGRLVTSLPPKFGLLTYHGPSDQLVAFPSVSDQPLLRHATDQQMLVLDLAKRQARMLACPTADRYGGVGHFGYSRDGQTAIVIHRDSNFAQLWDVTNWRVIAVLDGHQKTVTDGIFSADQNRIATASLDGTVKLWDAKTGGLLWTFVTLNYPQFIAFDTDDRELVVGSTEGIQRWRTE